MLLPLLIVSLLLLVLLGFYVFVAAPRSRPHFTFAIFIACLALWTIKDIVFWGFYAPHGRTGWWVGASFVIALLMQYSLVVFAWVFPENHPVPVRRAAVIFAPGAVLIPAALAGFMWERAGFTAEQFSVQLTPLAYFLVVYVYGLFAYGFGLLFVKYRHYRGTQQGLQLGAILWSLIITGLLKTVANIALPLFGAYWLLPIGSVFVLPGAFIYAYAISNFKLFSFQSALDQFRLFPIAFKVAISIAGVAIVSFALLQVPIVWWSFHNGYGPEAWRRYLVFSIISALFPNLLLVALIVRSISRPMRAITLAAVQVAGGEYGAQVDLRTNDEMGLLAESFNEMSRKMAADIEQLRHLNTQLIRTEKLAAAGTLAAGVAHEVNNPLASISSLIQILQARPNADDETREMLRLIATQITRITQVTRDMMEFARARPAQRTQQDLQTLVEASIRLASFDKEFHRLRLSTAFDAGVPLVSVDADQFQQVMLNLLLNARDAMSEGGELRISTNYDEVADEVVIEVADKGPGIAPEHRTHIFDPFYTTKSAGQGTGLGLAVCYGIVTAHGGRIEAIANDGAGTTFRISIPVMNEEESRN
ncbi:MAG: ATP-binding protein [Pyrinomonadaceae bacterium]